MIVFFFYSADDEESNKVHFRRPKQDSLSVAGPLTSDSVPLDVRQANQTSGILDTSGSAMPNFNFVVELHVEGQTEHELISLDFGFDDNVARSLLIYVDTSPVSVDIQHKEAPEKDLNK